MLHSAYGSQRLLVARHVHSCISSHITAVVFAKRIPFQQASSTVLNAEASQPNDPQVFASGYSPKLDLFEAIQEATEIALQALPKATQEDSVIHFGMITVSSLYDGQSQPSIVVPAVLSSASVYGKGIQQLLGCTTGGIVASTANFHIDPSDDSDEDDEQVQARACNTIESEGVPGVSVTLCLLPDVNVKVRPSHLSSFAVSAVKCRIFAFTHTLDLTHSFI